MDSEAHDSGRHPKTWGILGGTFWALVAFFLPQFALLPLVEYIDRLPFDSNTQLFIFQGLTELSAVLLLWWVMRRVYGAQLRSIGLEKVRPSMLGWAVVVFPLYLIVSTLAADIVGKLFSVDLLQTQDIGYSNPNTWGLVVIFLALVCLAPIVEEVLFRGFLFNAFRRTFGFWAGSIVVSLLFAVAHGQVNVGIDVFVLSMFLCYLRERTRSLWPAITLHALKNLVAFVVLFIMRVN